MLFMNDHDILVARTTFESPDTPNLDRATQVLARLADWADSVSDGWHSWPKPCRSAKNLQTLIQSKQRDLREDGIVSRPGSNEVVHFEDATSAEVSAACRPIKAFLTREGVDHAEVFGP